MVSFVDVTEPVTERAFVAYTKDVSIYAGEQFSKMAVSRFPRTREDLLCRMEHRGPACGYLDRVWLEVVVPLVIGP